MSLLRCLIVATALFALQGVADNQVARISIRGVVKDGHVSEIRRALGFSEGDPFNDNLIPNITKRIEANALFRSVQLHTKVIDGKVEILVDVVMEPRLEQITIQAPKAWLSFIESRVSLLRGERCNENDAKNLADDLKEAFRKMGYFQAEVNYELRADDRNNLLLSINVTQNEATRIGKIELSASDARALKGIQGALQVSEGSLYRRDSILDAMRKWRDAMASHFYFDAHAKLVREQYVPEKNTVDITVEAQSGPLYSATLNGVKYFSVRFLKQEVVSLAARSESNSSLPQRVKSFLKTLYRRHGFRDVEVKVSEDLNIEIDEGPQHLISKIVVTGATEEFNEDISMRLRAMIKDAYTSEFANDQAALFVDDLLVFDERSVARAKSQIHEELLEKGFLNNKVSGPQISINPKNHFAVLTFKVNFGVQTFVRSITVDSSVLSDVDSLKRCIALKEGDPLITSRLEGPRSCMEEELWNKGYPYAQVLTSVEVTPDGAGAAIRYKVKPGPLITITRVDVRGLHTTRPETMHSRIAISKGEKYSLERIVSTRQAFLNSDIFDRVEIYAETNEDSDESRVLVIEVHEKAKTSLELGAGASLEDGPRVSLLTNQRNLFGLGMGFRSRLQLNYPALFYRLPFLYPKDVMESLENRFKDESPFVRTLLYTEAKLSMALEYPYILVAPWFTDAIADFSLNRELKASYTLNRGGLDLGLSFKPSEHFRFGPSIDYEFAKFFCQDGYREGRGCGDGAIGSATRRIDSGFTQQATLRLAAAYDGRDSVLRPKNGFFADASVDVAFGGADLGVRNSPIGYAKLMGSVNVFRPLTKSATWQLSMRLGQIFDFAEDNYVPLFKRFYLGGTNSIRGFAEDQILPADDPDWPADAFNPREPGVLSRGGYFMALLRGEIRFPLNSDFDGAIFVDSGELLNSTSNFSFSSLAVGAGFGVRYLTPIGPLMFDIGVRIVDGIRAYNAGFWQLFGLHFSIGYF